MSPTTWSRVETGKPVRDLSYAGVDRALEWVDDASLGYLQGGPEPETLDDKSDSKATPSDNDVVHIRRKDLMELLEITERLARGDAGETDEERPARGDQSAG
jgi:hypothetical protein